MTARLRERLALFTGFCLGCSWFLLNLIFLSHYLDLDIVKYYHDQNQGRLFHPHHILFSFTGYLVAQTGRALGYASHPMFLLQLVPLFASSLLAIYLYRLLYRLARSYALAFLLLCLLYFSHAVWSYATLNDTPLIPALLALTTVLMALNLAWPRPGQRPLQLRDGLGLAAVHFLAIGFHQTMVLAVPAVTCILLWPPPSQRGPRLRSRLQFLLVYGVTLALAVLAMYTAAGILSGLDFKERRPFPGIPSGVTFFEWVLVYGHWDRSVQWGTFGRYDLAGRIAMGAGNTLFARSELPALFGGTVTLARLAERLTGPQPLSVWLSIGFALLALVGFVILLYQGRRGPGIPVGLGIWLVCAVVLASWWEPEHYEHWFSVLAASFAVLSLGLIQIWRIGWPFLAPLLTLFVLIMAGINFRTTVQARNSAVVFGYWEDLYDAARYTAVWNHLYRSPLPVRGGGGQGRREERRERLKLLLEQDGLRDFHAKYRLELEQVESAIEREESRASE